MRRLVCMLFCIPIILLANTADPWWNSNWHYRAELNINTAVINQTGKLDIDFTALGLPSSLDENSIRIVKSDGVTLLTKQEFTDVLYADATDGLNNDRGEVKFIIEEGGTVRYYIYYDTTANGSKTPLSASYVINGNFEHSSGSTPTAWVTGQANIGTNAPNNEVHPTGGEGTTVSVTDTGGTGQTRNTNNIAHTGNAFHIHGYRDQQESNGKREETWIEKTFSVPASSTGEMTYWLRIQGWDSVSFDFIRVSIDGTTIDHDNLHISDSDIRVNTNEYGESSNYSTYADSDWVRANFDLSGYAGQNITVRIMHQTASDDGWKFWQQLDDFEWSTKTVTTGSQEELIDLPGTATSCTKVEKIKLATYNTSGYSDSNGYADSASEFQTWITDNAISSKLFGSGLIDSIDVPSGSNNNPYQTDSDEYYLALMKGYIYFPDTGIYKIGIRGDDAEEVYIDGVLVTGWYHGHGAGTQPRYIKFVNASSGYHRVEYHMQEKTGGDSYYLYWQTPSGGSIVIIPPARYFHCIPRITKNSCVINDPVNAGTNPKRIPGATIRYAIQIDNETDDVIEDVIVDDNVSSNFDSATIQNLQIQSGSCNCEGVSSASNNVSPGTGNGENPVKLYFDTVAVGSTECGYFEVEIK